MRWTTSSRSDTVEVHLPKSVVLTSASRDSWWISLTRLLQQIPILDVVHCGPHFRALCDAVVRLFLLTDATRADVRAKRFVYDLLNEVEDALVFFDVYASVFAFAAAHYCSGDLCVDKCDLVSASDSVVVSAVDVYRLVLVLVQRMPHHWIHLSSEALARVQLATLQLLVSSPATQTTDTRRIRPFTVIALLDTNAQWFAAWLLKAPAHDQLFAAMHESSFVTELLQYLARVRVLETNASASESVVDAVDRRATQHVGSTHCNGRVSGSCCWLTVWICAGPVHPLATDRASRRTRTPERVAARPSAPAAPVSADAVDANRSDRAHVPRERERPRLPLGDSTCARQRASLNQLL